MFPPALDINWLALTPPLVLLFTAAAGLFFALFQSNGRSTAVLSLVGLVTAAVFTLVLFQDGRAGAGSAAFGLHYLADLPAAAFQLLIILGTVIAVLVSYDYLERTGLDHPEYYPLMLLSATGGMVMSAAGDLITLLLGLEITSLAVYVLSAWRQGARESEEAGMKYFLLGAFASAVLIYGIALTYGATGHFVYAEVVAAVTAPGFQSLLLATLGGLLLVAGLGFKASMVPFHQWAPDVYTGAPTAVTTFMSVVVKTAAFAALLRVASTILPELSPVVLELFVWIVGLTMIVGNLAAYVQRGVKRMLAYSAVAHAGYLGLAVLAVDSGGLQAATWYLLAYTLMTAGAFAVLTLLGDRFDHGDDLERFAGLSRTRPMLAAAMAIFMLSLAGIPPLAGFAGKVMVFGAALQAGYFLLAVIGILTSVVAAAYYFRVIAFMYFREPAYGAPRYRSAFTSTAVVLAAVGTVLLGLFPGLWYGLLESGARVVAGL
ncbi:MAG TPA: NADH-quinone oxidoreductase subunit N [Trueperaceae bacterium]